MSLTPETILQTLKAIQDPDLHKDIVTLGFVKDVKIQGGSVDLTIELTTPACPVKDQMKAQAEAAMGLCLSPESLRPLLVSGRRDGR